MEGGELSSAGLAGGYLSALILGVVEGLTEFLPVSSTGHLIVVGGWLNENSESAKLFEVLIQFGAILAVCWHYRRYLQKTARGLLIKNSAAQKLTTALGVAFLPAAGLGFLFHADIKQFLFSPQTVAVALIIGGAAIIVIEKIPTPVRITGVEDIGARDALWIGLAQSLALVPGVSRAAATIMGAMVAGASRKTATEFSFFLAIPTMFAAGVYDLWQNRDLLNAHLGGEIIFGFAVSFFTALLAVRALLHYVARHDFTPFGWYRIIFGGAILAATFA